VLLTLRDGDGRPLYRQIASALRRAIAEGQLAPGERLPPGRELADALDVNLDTVQRGYRLLADEGLVVARVGRGTRVVDDPPVAALALHADVEALVARARSLGIGAPELRDMVEEAASGG
jgi:GntR family transcriptional regulator